MDWTTRNIQCAYDTYSDMIGWVSQMLSHDSIADVKWSYSDLNHFVRQRCKDTDGIELFETSDNSPKDYFVETEFSVPAKSLASGLQAAHCMLKNRDNFPIYSAVHIVDNTMRYDPLLYKASDSYADYLNTRDWLSVSKFTGNSHNTRPLGTVLLRDNLMYQLALLAQGKTGSIDVVNNIKDSIESFKPSSDDMRISWSGYVNAKNPLEAVHKTIDMMASEQQNHEQFNVAYAGQQRMLRLDRAAGLKVVKNKFSLV